MKQLFFEKGEKQQFSPNGQYLLQTSSNLDSKKYILQKIPMEIFLKEVNYIENHFYLYREDNLISYFNCWKQTQTVIVQKPVIKQKQKKRDKRTMLDVMKRKTLKDMEHSTVPSRKKITQEQLHIEYTMQDFIYVQMQYFSPIDIPVDFANLRDMMTIIYLLGRRVQSRTGCIPCMIPVKNQQNDRIKFFKKGISLQLELYRLMLYMMKQKHYQAFFRQWSQTLYKSIHKAMINHDQHLVGSLMKMAIEEYMKQPLMIGLVKQEEKMCCIQTARIVDWRTLVLVEEGIEIPVEEYTVSYLLKSQSDREITLTHEVFQQYTLSGKKNNLIVKWLFNMAT